MTPYDLAMIAVVVAGMIWGALRGITWQVASIASLVLGYLLAVPLSSQLAPHFPGAPIVARALAMLAVYVAVSGAIYLVAWSIRAILREWKFEAYDRHLGMILGGAEGAMLGTVITIFVVSLAPQTRHPILTSPSGRVVAQVLNGFQPVLPTEISAELAPFWSGPDAIAARRSAQDPKPDSTRDQAADDIPTSTVEKSDSSAASQAVAIEGLIKKGAARVGRVVSEAVEAEKQLEQAGETNDRVVKCR
jgi:membrane protein required for colicin V production